MAHPYHLHREHQVSHRRVAPLLKEEASGATKHAKGNAFSKVTSKTAAESHNGIAGSAAPKRYARGGKVKRADGGPTPSSDSSASPVGRTGKERIGADGKVSGFARGGKVKGNTTNIIIAGGGQKAQPTPVPVPMPGPGGPPPMGGPPPGPPMGPPPGAGGPPPGMPMRASGGRISGESTKGNIAGMAGRAAKNSYAKGGGVKMTAGSESGVGRLELAKAAKRQRGK